MNDIILIGGGGHCKAVIDIIEQEGRFKIIGILDKPELLGADVLGYEIIGNDSELKIIAKKCKNVFITVGQIKSALPRIKLFNAILKLELNLPTIISPRAYISKHASLGIGSIIMHDVVLAIIALLILKQLLSMAVILEIIAIFLLTQLLMEMLF